MLLTPGFAASPGVTTRPPRLTSHTRGGLPCQLPTSVRTVPAIRQSTSRVRASASSAPVPSKAGWSMTTTTPAGGSSGADVAVSNPSRTAASSARSAVTTFRCGPPKRSAKSVAVARAAAPSASTSQLPVGDPAAGADDSAQRVSKIFCDNGNGTVRRWMRLS